MPDARPTLSRGDPPGRRAWRRFRRRPGPMTALVLLFLLLGAVLLADVGWGQDPNRLSETQWAPPSLVHWLGTDANGRDVVARVCAGARVSLMVGLAGAAISLVIGVSWGAVAGWLGGRWDALLMRTVDVLYSLPSVILMIVLLTAVQVPVNRALVGAFGAGAERWAPMLLLSAGLGGISWLTMARLVRAQVIGLRQRAFIEAGRALGAGGARLLWRHVLPNTAGVIMVTLTLTVPGVVLGESFLSYLGLGIQPPQASLGTLIAEGAGQINPVRSHAWLLAGPAGVLVVLLVCLGLIGDGIRDALDPKSGAS